MTCFSINKLIRGHTYRCFMCGPICPQCSVQLLWPIFSAFSHHLHEDSFELLVRCFRLAICVWMIGCRHPMLDSHLCQTSFKILANKVWSTIIYLNSRNVVLREYHHLDHLNGLFHRCFPTWNCFNPFLIHNQLRPRCVHIQSSSRMVP
jgi:hypothetical protein